jgi:O-6-methylguanine DNA methyltransferase
LGFKKVKHTGEVFCKIYETVKNIPCGKVATYGAIAKVCMTSPRVVGWALHKNPDPKNIPCHRVVFQNGSLSTGFAFGGVGVQRELLEKENVKFIGDRVQL